MTGCGFETRLKINHHWRWLIPHTTSVLNSTQINGIVSGPTGDFPDRDRKGIWSIKTHATYPHSFSFISCGGRKIEQNQLALDHLDNRLEVAVLQLLKLHTNYIKYQYNKRKEINYKYDRRQRSGQYKWSHDSETTQYTSLGSTDKHNQT